MFDQIVVGIRGVILRYALQPVKEVSGADQDEPVDADISDVGAVPIVPVADVAMLLDVLTAGAMIPFIAYLDGDQIPFLTRHLEIRSDGQRKYMRFEVFEVGRGHRVPSLSYAACLFFLACVYRVTFTGANRITMS